jgi:hypothetical protein
MVTVAQSPTPHKSHRRAYGAHRQTTPQQRAQYGAESITTHGLSLDDGATWQRYGLDGNLAQQQRVRAALVCGDGRGSPEPLFVGCRVASLGHGMAGIPGLLPRLGQAERRIGPQGQPAQPTAAPIHEKPGLAPMGRDAQSQRRRLAIEVIHLAHSGQWHRGEPARGKGCLGHCQSRRGNR